MKITFLVLIFSVFIVNTLSYGSDTPCGEKIHELKGHLDAFRKEHKNVRKNAFFVVFTEAAEACAQEKRKLTLSDIEENLTVNSFYDPAEELNKGLLINGNFIHDIRIIIDLFKYIRNGSLNGSVITENGFNTIIRETMKTFANNYNIHISKVDSQYFDRLYWIGKATQLARGIHSSIGKLRKESIKNNKDNKELYREYQTEVQEGYSQIIPSLSLFFTSNDKDALILSHYRPFYDSIIEIFEDMDTYAGL